MADQPEGMEEDSAADDAPPKAAAKRSPGHRGMDAREAAAEMAARAHEISLEAGSKMAGAMRDVINAAAGLAGFAVESARDLVQYMVRRGQMTQDEADKLIREAEAASGKRAHNSAHPPAPVAQAAPATPPAPAPAAAAPTPAASVPAEPAGAAEAPPAARKDAGASKKAPAKTAEKAPKAAKAEPEPKSAAKSPAKSAAKAAKPAKTAAKTSGSVKTAKGGSGASAKSAVSKSAPAAKKKK